MSSLQFQFLEIILKSSYFAFEHLNAFTPIIVKKKKNWGFFTMNKDSSKY